MRPGMARRDRSFGCGSEPVAMSKGKAAHTALARAAGSKQDGSRPGNATDGRGFMSALLHFRAVVDLVARVENDLVAFVEALYDLRLNAVLATNFHFLNVRDAVLH